MLRMASEWFWNTCGNNGGINIQMELLGITVLALVGCLFKRFDYNFKI